MVNSLIRSDVHRSDAYHASLRWLNDVQCGLDFGARRPEITLQVGYADLVARPETVLSDVLAFLGLAPDHLPDPAPVGAAENEYSEFYANIHAKSQPRANGGIR